MRAFAEYRVHCASAPTPAVASLPPQPLFWRRSSCRRDFPLDSSSREQPRGPIGKATVILAVVFVSVVAVAAYEWTSGGAGGSGNISTSSSGQTGEAIFIQVVNESGMAPMAGTPVLAGPASSPNDVTFTPAGIYTLIECVHEVPNGAVVGNGTVVVNGTTTTVAACPLKEYKTDASGRISITDPSGPFYFIEAGGNFGWNDIVVGVEANNVVNMTIPVPSGNVTTPWGSPGATPSRLTVLSPQTTTVWPCGQGLPSGSAVTAQGVYAGEYVAFSYAALPNGTKAALREDCAVGGL